MEDSFLPTCSSLRTLRVPAYKAKCSTATIPSYGCRWYTQKAQWFMSIWGNGKIISFWSPFLCWRKFSLAANLQYMLDLWPYMPLYMYYSIMHSFIDKKKELPEFYVLISTTVQCIEENFCILPQLVITSLSAVSGCKKNLVLEVKSIKETCITFRLEWLIIWRRHKRYVYLKAGRSLKCLISIKAFYDHIFFSVGGEWDCIWIMYWNMCTQLWKMISNHHQKLATKLLDHHLKPVAESCQGKNDSVYPYHCSASVTECHRSHARLVVWYLSLHTLATRKEQENISITSLTKDSLLNHELVCFSLPLSLSVLLLPSLFL